MQNTYEDQPVKPIIASESPSDQYFQQVRVYSKNTMDSQFSMKSVPCGIQLPDLNERLAQYFTKTYELYQRLFTVIKSEHSYYTRPEPLRHPLIFYYGHTASFFVNKLMDKGIFKQRVNQEFERTFAVGVDQNDWDDLDQTHYSWPTLSETTDFRKKVKNAVLQVIKNNHQTQINWESNMWAVLMAIDHERLHLQTSAVIIRRLPAQELTPCQWLKECPFRRDHLSKLPHNVIKTVPAVQFTYDKSIEKANYYGWDSQFGTKTVKTKQFRASKMLVSNGQFLQFYLDDGYMNQNFWNDEGKKWLSNSKTKKPVFWTIKDKKTQDFKNFYLKTLTGQIEMPWDWPVEVNNLEARAFCNWKSKKTGKRLRLPTQDQYFALRYLLKTDYEDWKYQSVGNINLEFWCSPCPVDFFQVQGFCDIVGNVLQHTITPFYPFENFKIHPLYEDFTTPAYDGRHDIIKGGCFINTGNSASMYYRTGFRRHFYLFTGFRYVESDNPQQLPEYHLNQSDESIKQALKLHYDNKQSYVKKIIDFVFSKKGQLGTISLVVGCSVGRLPLQLSKMFESSYGIDYTARYFQMASRLCQKGQLTYQDVLINLKEIGMSPQLFKNVRLYQMNPLNTDKNKINNISFMIIDGFNLKCNTIKKVIQNCFNLYQQGQNSYALIICPHQNNKITQIEQTFEQILDQKDQITIIQKFDIENTTKDTKEEATVYFAKLFRHINK